MSVAGRLDAVGADAPRPARSSASPGSRARGTTTVLELVAGRRRADAGRVLLPGRPAGPARAARRRSRAGVALVSGDRRRFGLMLDKPVWDNVGQVRAVALAADGPS